MRKASDSLLTGPTRWLLREDRIFFVTFLLAATIIPLLLAGPNCPLLLVVLLEVLMIPISLEISEIFAAVLVKPMDLPRLETLRSQPRVALLYLVCDDYVHRAAHSLGEQTYPSTDVFILDDSEHAVADRLPADLRCTILRREHRRHGYKAGSLNNWLRLHGASYEYFIVLDSDSILPSSFVADILLYAEHTANATVAIFNSLTENWNVHTHFSKTIGDLAPVGNWMRLRLANRYGSVLSVGHNNLHRTRAVLQAAGFSEEYVAEDIAVTLRLATIGFRSQVVNVLSYDSEPSFFPAYAKRLLRWARQNTDILRADWRRASPPLKFQIFKLNASYWSPPLLLLWGICIAWVGEPVSGDWVLTASTSAILRLGLVVTFLSLALPLIAFVIKLPIIRIVRLPIRRYLMHYLLTQAIGIQAMLDLTWAQLKTLGGSRPEFSVTPKDSRLGLHTSHVRHWLFGTVLVVLIIIGGLIRDPLRTFVLAPYLLSVALSPVVIRMASKPATGLEPKESE